MSMFISITAMRLILNDNIVLIIRFDLMREQNFTFRVMLVKLTLIFVPSNMMFLQYDSSGMR